MYFLFSDSEVWQHEILASNWRQAVKLARNNHNIQGSLRMIRWNGTSRDYKLVGTRYTFTLRQVN